MKNERKIALTYTGIISSIVALVFIIFFITANLLLNQLVSTNEIDSNVLCTLKQTLIGLLVCFFLVSTLLIYLVGHHYASRMIKRIDDAYRSEKVFIRSASHEMNNPLTAIQGECEITLLKERTVSEYQSSLKRILSETKRLIQLMKHLLFLSRGDEEFLQNATEPILLGEYLMGFLQKRINFSPDHFSFQVNANPHLLKIAIENIISNALKYSGEKIVQIRLRANQLEIEDEGIGIPQEDLEHIFQPFFRARNTTGYEGYGIGLSLALRILQVYGAKIIVYSELHKGTKVTIIFP